MNATDHQLETLFRDSSSDLSPEVADLVAGGIARGRARRRRQGVGAALATVAVFGVIGVAASVAPGLMASDSPRDGGSVATAPSASPTPTAPLVPRELAMRAAGVPETYASLFPGQVALIDGKENPMDGFDPRSRPGSGQEPDFTGEPGPGVIADFTWNGYYVRASVAPSDPAFGDTALERCRAEEGGGNGICQPRADGGALRSGETTNPPVDGTTTVRWAQYYTPDLWMVSVMVSNGSTSRDGVLTAEPPMTEQQLAGAVTSDVWFSAP